MKNVVYRLFGLVAISFCVCLAQAEDVWTLVTDASTLQIGDKVVIVSSVDNRALGTTQKTNNRNAVEITKNTDNTCVINENVQQLTLHQGKKTNTFAFYTGNGYLYAASSSNNHLKTEASLSNNSSWSISITSEGIATIVAQGTYGNNNLRYNPTTIFSAYPASSTGTRMTCLYKLSEVQKQPTTIQFNDNAQIAEYESYIGASFSLPSEASVIEGLEFVGWSKEPIAAGAAVANDAILSPGTSVVIEEDMTFYAVYAKPVESGESAYIKVETEQEDWSGTYLIVCESSGKAFNSSLGKSALFPTDGLNVVDIAINDSKIAHNEVNEQYEFVIAKYNEGYSIKSKSEYYIGCNTTGSYVIQDNPFLNSIEFESNNLLSIISNGYWLFYDNNKSRFIYTANNNERVQLYKRSETTKSYAFYTTSLSTEVAINKYGYSTWYAGMPVAVPEGMKAYYCIVDGNTAVLNDMGTVIPANTGAVLYAEEAIGTGGNYAMSYTNESITTDITKNLLIGYVQDTEVNNGKAHYALNVKDNVVGFYVPKTTEEGTTPSATSTFTAKAGKAYLELEPTASAVSLVIRRNSDTSIDAATVIPENIIYDLTGRRVITPSKGIYIVNGRKVTM
ncbi:MAG: hypothetical protein IKL03_08230 [Bacteroidaceae bacterium]|nr:hypothetical protein [Bacteroidaceae bacterium]